MFFAGDETLDTIAAPATPPGPGVRAVVRVAGPEALRALEPLFAPSLLRCPGARVVEGRLRVDGVELLACAWVFRAPRSYTGDDLVELHLPSAPAFIDRLLFVLVGRGVRLARPGEFTRRAFLRERLDLAQAEAVLALGTAEDAAAARLAARQLRGALGREVERLRAALLDLLAELEAAIDFTEDDLDHELLAESAWRERLSGLAERIDAILRREAARPTHAGTPRVVLFGPPNAGKSTLFNALLGTARAIASPHAGTTRDAVCGLWRLDAERCVELLDLAGVSEERERVGAADAIDREAQRRALAMLEGADVVLFVNDGARPLDAQAERLRAHLTDHAPLEVATKVDLGRAPWTEREEVIAVSALCRTGLEVLVRRLRQRLGYGASPAAHLAPNARHRLALERARAAIARALEGEGAMATLAPELRAIELRTALDALGEVTGSAGTEDMLDRLFSRFCIGK